MDILALPYGKMLVLGAISAASAFIVTIFIVLVCVGCHKKGKSKHSHASIGSQKKDMRVASACQSKLRSISKSDTRLHELHRLPCSANGAPRERPVSMDLLLLQSHRSTTALYTSASSDQLTCNLTGPESEQHDHFDPEDEGLYERVGVCRAPPLSPPLNLDPNQVITENKQAAGGGVESKRLNEAGQGGVMAEYASVRKVRKLERGKRQEESEEENTSESSSSTVPRKAMEPFHIPSFPKGAVSKGNGEEYIWKPPEESDQSNGHSNACSTEIFETYSTVCKPLKKQNLKPTQQISGQIGSGEKDPEEPVPVPSREHYYAAVGEKTWSKSLDSDPAYATINPMQKREMLCSSTLKPKKSPCGPSKGPERAMTCENFYETIGDVKQSTNTTTIFTFKDGMEMYVTGL
ncbi:uncharacterized protein Hap1MRO34_024630 [Clarias gariepinus]